METLLKVRLVKALVSSFGSRVAAGLRALKLTIAVGFLVPTAAVANLLVNAGFESGDFTGWTLSGAAPSSGVDTAGTAIPGSGFSSTVAVKDGNFAAWGLVRGNCCTPAEEFTLSQTISVLPGTDYVIGFFGNNQSNRGVGYGTGDAVNLIQIFVDGVGLLPTAGHNNCPANCFDPSLGWIDFESTFNSGLASSVTVSFRIIASGTSYVGISLDDFHVDAVRVPEPATLALLGLGLAGLGFARRKQ